jgi:hypothetical protein
MIFQFQRRTHNMNVMSVLLLGWTLWDPTTCGPVQLKAFFSTSYRETLKSKAVHHIYIYVYIYIKQFQEATTTTPTIHGPSEKSNNLAQHLAGEMEYPPRRRRGRVSSCGRAGRAGTEDAAQDQDGKGPRAAAVEGWWNSYIYLLYILYILYIYIVYTYYIYILYITIWYYMYLS